jgi:hypothetical protein
MIHVKQADGFAVTLIHVKHFMTMFALGLFHVKQCLLDYYTHTLQT